jgi:mitochondrial GTPase 1
MVRSLRELPGLLKDVDLVIEARDARLPLTSVNPAFDEVLEGVWGKRVDVGGVRRKKKLVVYTKRDLAEKRFEQVRPGMGVA